MLVVILTPELVSGLTQLLSFSVLGTEVRGAAGLCLSVFVLKGTVSVVSANLGDFRRDALLQGEAGPGGGAVRGAEAGLPWCSPPSACPAAGAVATPAHLLPPSLPPPFWRSGLNTVMRGIVSF